MERYNYKPSNLGKCKTPLQGGSGFYKIKNGEWVKHKDHEKEIKRLRKEKEWLLKQYATELYDAHKAIRTTYNRDSIKQRIVLEMQQALKERE